MEPAYGIYKYDSFMLDGSVKVNMDNLIKYGAYCKVDFTTDNTSDKDITVNVGGKAFIYNALVAYAVGEVLDIDDN